MRQILLNSCAMAASAEEARFRIDAPIRGREGARVIALDQAANEVVRRVAGQPWHAARFFTLPAHSGNGNGSLTLCTLDGVSSGLAEQLAAADVVVMIATGAGDAHAAAAIGNACAVRGIMTAGLIIGDGREALGALRPYARVLMVTHDETDVTEVLTALRA